MEDVTAPERIFAFDNSYARLPERLFARVLPAPATDPRLLLLNRPLARDLGLDPDRLTEPDAVAVLAGDMVAPGSEPIAMAYAGHQFGNWVPRLGDGRALLLGEIIDRRGQRRDIQLKGSGRTPFSRMGDGKAPLGPALREFLISEAMAALGIPTTRSLAVVATGEHVLREDALRGAVLTRVASSHVRIGTFQYFHARNDVEALRVLADHVMARHYPDLASADVPALALLDAVMRRQAELVARWMGVGFIHGVMNTDNMTISGETIDYGPCAFMDTHDQMRVFSSIDAMGRYAYGNQPRIAHWNLAQLGRSLLPLIPGSDEDAVAAAQETVNRFPEMFKSASLGVMRRKLGLASEAEEDGQLISDLFAAMEAGQADFTLTFRGLANLAAPVSDPPVSDPDDNVRDLFQDPAVFDAWRERWEARLASDGQSANQRHDMMLAASPRYIPRNHRVEAALAAAEGGDLEPLKTLHLVLARPFEEQPEHASLAEAPGIGQAVYRTFCGT